MLVTQYNYEGKLAGQNSENMAKLAGAKSIF